LTNFVGKVVGMETIIKMHPSELNSTLLNKIQEFIGDKKNIDVTITLKEFDPEYADDLYLSIDQAEKNEIISFTMEEFMAYAPMARQ
jgi:hypothetical protein